MSLNHQLLRIMYPILVDRLLRRKTLRPPEQEELIEAPVPLTSTALSVELVRKIIADAALCVMMSI
jgi:hypothetical protein